MPQKIPGACTPIYRSMRSWKPFGEERGASSGRSGSVLPPFTVARTPPFLQGKLTVLYWRERPEEYVGGGHTRESLREPSFVAVIVSLAVDYLPPSHLSLCLRGYLSAVSTCRRIKRVVTAIGAPEPPPPDLRARSSMNTARIVPRHHTAGRKGKELDHSILHVAIASISLS